MGHLQKTAVFVFIAFLAVIGGAFPSHAAGKSIEVSVFRPKTGVWYSASADHSGAFRGEKWGVEGDMPVPGDFDGDGLEDMAVWRPADGIFVIRRSSDLKEITVRWGHSVSHEGRPSNHVSVPADYDGDGATDIAVWRPENGMWYLLLSSTDFDTTRAVVSQWGRTGDIPVPADYDGDGKADLAIFRPSENGWYIRESRSGEIKKGVFGLAGDDLLAPGDYNGNGHASPAVYRRGTWLILDMATGSLERFEMGTPDAIPVLKDFDGDGIIDPAVFDNGTWYVYCSAKPRFMSYRFGQAGDIPVDSLRVMPSTTRS